jgi:arylsulfatase A-like enzyme
LLYFAHTFPHIPLHASPQFRGRSKGGLYGDCVEEIDWSVGRVLEALERNGVADNTFVFFTSDNGPWYEGRTGEIRGRKGSFMDGGRRVPGIARFPGVIPENTVSDQMAMNIDLFATSLALAGADAPADRPIDGLDILPMLQGKAGTPHEALYFYGGIMGRHLRAMRTQRWKYHRRHAFWTANYFPMQKGPMLYDLELDQGESFNVSHLYPEVCEKLSDQMDRWEKDLKRGAPRR